MPFHSWHIIDSTLREGEQFALGNFTMDDKIELVRALDAFGVEFIELTTPAASPAARRASETEAGLGLRARILTHTPADLRDAQLAVECGVDGVDILFGTSSELRRFSHGRDVHEIIERASRTRSARATYWSAARTGGSGRAASTRRALRFPEAAGIPPGRPDGGVRAGVLS